MSPPVDSVQQQIPVPPPNTDAPSAQVQGLTEAVTKGVEAALKTILASGYFLPNSKQSPRKRKVQVKEVDEIRAAESKDERYFILVGCHEKHNARS